MQAPHVGRCEEGQDHGVASVILPSRRAARKPNYCIGCDAPLTASWHTLCLKCYRGAALYQALIKYREVARHG